jgi:hypothetical protein
VPLRRHLSVVIAGALAYFVIAFYSIIFIIANLESSITITRYKNYPKRYLLLGLILENIFILYFIE